MASEASEGSVRNSCSVTEPTRAPESSEALIKLPDAPEGCKRLLQPVQADESSRKPRVLDQASRICGELREKPLQPTRAHKSSTEARVFDQAARISEGLRESHLKPDRDKRPQLDLARPSLSSVGLERHLEYLSNTWPFPHPLYGNYGEQPVDN